jgi:hypothetical protein
MDAWPYAKVARRSRSATHGLETAGWNPHKIKAPGSLKGITGARAALPQNCPRGECMDSGTRKQAILGNGDSNHQRVIAEFDTTECEAFIPSPTNPLVSRHENSEQNGFSVEVRAGSATHVPSPWNRHTKSSGR